MCGMESHLVLVGKVADKERMIIVGLLVKNRLTQKMVDCENGLKYRIYN